jgi:putative selenium metabolism hydrolase
MVKKEERKKEVVTLCKSLISAKSYSGEEEKVVTVLRDYMQNNGFDEVKIDPFGNIIGKIIGKRPGKRILFDGHVDTVPIGEEKKWTEDPFLGTIKDGKLYGRGTTDMKGAIAAFLLASIAYAKETKKDFPGEIYIAGVVHEECFEGVAARAISEFVKPDFVVIGEASNLDLKIGQRGRAELVIETFGIPAHSASPEKGVNAVYMMSKIIEKIQTITPKEHPILGKGIMELTDIISSPYPGASVVPEYCRATYDRRLLVGETKESVLAPVKGVIEELKKNFPKLEASVSFAFGSEKCYTGKQIEGERFFPGWLQKEEEPVIQNIKKKLHDLGFHPAITKYNFCTNGSHYAGEAGIMTVGMGPSIEGLAHTINEYVEVKQLEDVMECYYGILQAVLI